MENLSDGVSIKQCVEVVKSLDGFDQQQVNITPFSLEIIENFANKSGICFEDAILLQIHCYCVASDHRFYTDARRFVKQHKDQAIQRQANIALPHIKQIKNMAKLSGVSFPDMAMIILHIVSSYIQNVCETEIARLN